MHYIEQQIDWYQLPESIFVHLCIFGAKVAVTTELKKSDNTPTTT